jgi:hypothetical protein
MYLNALGWSVRPKHVAYIDESKNIVIDGSMYVNCNVIYRNEMNFRKKTPIFYTLGHLLCKIKCKR